MRPDIHSPPAPHQRPYTQTVRARLLLLIVDPDSRGADALAAALQRLDIDGVVTADPADAIAHAAALLPDAVLTVDTPRAGGAVLAHTLRTRTGIPAIVSTPGPPASVDPAAAGYVPYPYQVADVLPILRTLSPDPHPDRPVALEVGGLHLDPVAVEVRHRGRRVDLPLREFQLLHLLMLHAGRVVTRTQINQLVWCRQDETSNTLTVHIHRLRLRLGDDPHNPKTIVAVRSLGYRLDAWP